MKEVNFRINAVVGNRFSEAITEAKICDEQLKAGKFDIETLEREKPLFGLPFSVKETCALKGTDEVIYFFELVSYGDCST
jgi:fatty acid amide hydrolase 2